MVCVPTWVEGSYVAVVLMALVLLPWLSSVSAKHPNVYKQIQYMPGVHASAFC